MKIRNRMADVVELRCHICQNFLKLIVCEDWRQELYRFTQEKIKGPYKVNYMEQHKIMRKKGIENYSIDDMDVPFIVNILCFCPQIAKVSKITSKALSYVKEDRHETNHSSENEPEEELYLRALISLRDLQGLLHTIDLNEIEIPDEQRSQFVMEYSKDIENLKLEIYNDCIEMFQIKKDIQLIISSDNQDDTFFRIFQSYNDKSCLSDENKEQMSRFLIEASNRGVRSAHKYAAMIYLHLYHDLEEATHRYEMMIANEEKLSASEAHELIDFINHMYMKGKQPTDRMMQFVKLIKEQGFNIEETSQGIIWKKRK